MLSLRETVRTIEIAGWVADFCPICRKLRAFVLRTASRAESEIHLVGIFPIAHETEAVISGHDRVCDDCGFCAPTSIHAYAAILKDKAGDLDTLIHATQPDAPRRFANRLEMESILAAGSLPPEAREALLAETIHALDPHLDRVLPASLRGSLWKLPLGLIAGGVALGLAAAALPDHPEMIAGIAGFLAVLAGMIGLLAFAIRAWLRPAFVKRALILEAYPLLVRAWRPLDPRREEVEKVLAGLRASGSRLAREIAPDRLLAELA
jgi:hypothetical protein